MNKKILMLLTGMLLALSSHGLYAANSGTKSLGGLIAGFPQCYQYKIAGLCGGWIPKGFVVHHFLPKAYIEVIKKAGDSVFNEKSGDSNSGDVVPSGGFASSQWHHFEVRIWHIDDDLRALLTLNLSNCALCKDVHAGGPAQEFADNGDENLSESDFLGGQFMSEVAGGGNCVATYGSVGAALSKLVFSQLGEETPLLYDSSGDRASWHTGCRDISISFQKLPQTLVECLGGIKGGAANETPAADSPVPNNMDRIANQTPCIGPWGAKFPRTGWSWGRSEKVSAATAAYRGMHNAAYEFETYGCPVGDDQMMQPVYPEFGKCFAVGAGLQEVDAAVAASDNGRYAFVWYTPVGCCINFSQYFSCMG